MYSKTPYQAMEFWNIIILQWDIKMKYLYIDTR